MRYLLKLGLKPWRIACAQQLMSVVSMGALILLSGALLWMDRALGPVVDRLAHSQILTAYLDPSIDPSATEKLVDQIRLAAGAHAEPSPLVRQTEFVDQIRKGHPDLARELEDLGPEMASVIPQYFSVAGLMPNDAQKKIRALPGVESVESSRDRNFPLLGAFSSLRWVLRILAAALGIALLCTGQGLARLNAGFHRESMALLKIWGATNWALRMPPLLSGLSTGLASGVLALAFWRLGAVFFTERLAQISPFLGEMGAPQAGYGIWLLAAGAVLGVMSALAESVQA